MKLILLLAWVDNEQQKTHLHISCESGETETNLCFWHISAPRVQIVHNCPRRTDICS